MSACDLLQVSILDDGESPHSAIHSSSVAVLQVPLSNELTLSIQGGQCAQPSLRFPPGHSHQASWKVPWTLLPTAGCLTHTRPQPVFHEFRARAEYPPYRSSDRHALAHPHTPARGTQPFIPRGPPLVPWGPSLVPWGPSLVSWGMAPLRPFASGQVPSQAHPTAWPFSPPHTLHALTPCGYFLKRSPTRAPHAVNENTHLIPWLTGWPRDWLLIHWSSRNSFKSSEFKCTPRQLLCRLMNTS